jgi:predicted Rossmann-fold nucleotide-binding protein
MKTVTYFSGARAGNNPVYKAAAERIGDFIGRQKYFAKYGGSRTELMKACVFP